MVTWATLRTTVNIKAVLEAQLPHLMDPKLHTLPWPSLSCEIKGWGQGVTMSTSHQRRAPW